MGHKNMKSKKRKQAVDSGPTSEMTKVKDEPISPNDVICLSDNSSSNDSSDDSTDSSDSSDSTDDDTDSRDSEDLKVVVSDGKTQFSVKFSKKMSMKEFKRMYVVIRRIVRRNKIPSSINVINFHLKKGKKVIRKEKKKQHKIRKKDFTKTANQCTLTDKTEPKIEPKTECAEEIENQANPFVWVNPANSQPEKLNSGHTLQLSNLKDKIISSDRNIESFLIENVDANRIKIAINNPDSFRRYEDLNNADLDYIEETMDLNLQLATELASKNPGENTECLFNLSKQNTSQPPLKIIHNTSFEQEIKYEPELNISEDDEEFRPTKNVSNVPLKQKVKDEPLEVQSKVADSGIADRMSNTVLTDLEQVMIKNEPVKEEPVSSKDDVITLSDDEEDHKKPIIEISCNKKIETEKTEENSEKALHDCNNISKDTELSDSSDDDLKYHERLRKQLMKEISMLSENEDTADEHFENDYPTSSKKRNRKKIFSSSDNSDYARINSAGKKKRRTKIARNKSDDENETTDEEATFGDLLGNQSNESNADSRKVPAKKNKYSNRRESHARPKSREEMRPLNEKDLQGERKSHCNRRTHDGTKAFDEESSSVKKRRSDEKLADKKKSSHEKMPGEKSEVEKSFKEEKLKEEISDRLNKSEQNVKIHKNNANRRHSSEAKSTRISENYNNNSNENSSCAKTAVDPRSMLCGNPVVLLAKVDDQIKVSSPSESVIRAKDKNNINIITKSSTKQESQTASTRNINSQDNKRKVPTPESKYSVSKSTTKLNSDFTLKSKLETQNDLDMNKSFTKEETQAASTRSIDSLGNKRKVLSPEPEYSASTSTKKLNRDLTLRSKLEIQNDMDMNKSFTKEETQVASTRSIDSLGNKRKVLSPEPEYSASTSTKKLNRDLTLRSKLETQNDLDMNKSFIKEETQAASTRSIDSLDNKRKVLSPEPEYSASTSTKKLNKDLTLRSKLETQNDLDMNKSFTKEETQVASTRSIDSLGNKRKVLSPEPEYSASTSTKKLNRDLTLRSKLETQNDLDMNKSFTKEETQAASTRSIDSLDNKRKVLSPEPEYSASTSTKKLNKDLTLRSKLETQNDLDMSKSFIKEETQAASTRSIDSLDNKRKVFSPEMEYSTSKSAKKLKRDLALRSETDTKRGPEKNQQRHKSTDSVSIDKLNASKIEQYEEGTFNEATMKILFEQSQQKVEEIKTLAINSGVTIVKLQMTMEARGHLVNEEPDKLAKQSVEFKQTSLVNKTFDKHETANEFSEESGKSVKLAKEMAMKHKISLADCDKSANVKTENRRSVELNSEKSFIEKLPSVNSNDFSKINAEMYKSPNVATEIFPKSERTNAESVAKIFPETTNFPYDVERKPVKSFVGRIPKKTVCQSNISPMQIASNDKRNFAHSSNKNSNTYEGKSPIENNAQSKLILSKVIQMVKEAKVQNMQNIPPLMPESPVKKPRPSIDEFLNRVLQLNPVCFKQIDESIIRKVFGEDYIGIRQSYESYLDYYRDTETLLILKLLESMTDPRSKISHFRCSIVEGSMRSKKKSRMITLKLEVRMSKRDSQTKRYPRKGDLITLTYTSREENKRFVENEVFAFIERVQDQDISERTFCNKNTQYKLRSYIVRTKYIDDHQIGFGTMTTIRKSHNKMQDFAGLKNLLYSPLLNNIIHPKVEDYQLPVVNSENYLLNTGDVLNAQQKDAIIRITETAIRRDPKICLIQGSPATGKTTVVINLVSQLINRSSKLDKESRFRILVCTHSNSAADEIAVRLLEERQKTLKAERLRMLRVGHYNNIDQRVRDITLEDLTKKELNRFINAAMSYDDKKIRESIEFHRMQYNKLKKQIKHAKWYGTRNQIARKIQDYEARLEFLENRQLDIKNSPLHKALSRAVETTVLEGAQVIVCTVTTSFKNYMESVFLGDENGFSVCIIDDSTKSSEIATLLPLSLGVKTLVLVGDTIQQPYSESIIPGQRNKLDGLDQSLFARLWQAFDGHPENPIIQFQTQYRMAYPIIYWPHQYFYKGDFHSPANVRTLNLHCYKVMDLPFIQNDDEAINDDEGKFVARLIRILMNRAGLDTSEKVRIGVITPYHSQKMLLNEEIKRVLDTQPIEVKEKIIVDLNTIDGIQGQERDVIIMSCTLSKGTGLLSDKQKLCLALTRAKSCMILCGNFEKYKRDKMWGHLIKDAETRKFYVEVKQDASDDDITKCIVRVPQHRIPDDVSTLR